MKKKEKGILYKLDIAKTYDRINWEFLFGVLQKIGFRAKWVFGKNMCNHYFFYPG